MANQAKTFIIAEVGVNHNGSLKKALKYIDIAASLRGRCSEISNF